MPAHRFYIDKSLDRESSFSLSGEEFHHMTRVMRHQEGDRVELINGRGDLMIACLEKIERNCAHLRMEALDHVPPPAFQLQLGIPWMRPSKLQWIVEKGTELGVSSFLLFRASRSEIEHVSQMERLHTLLISALKQSGRLHLPTLHLFPTLSSLVQQPHATLLFGCPKGNSVLPPLQSPLLFITGPESGFTPEEQKLLQTQGMGISLSPYILRAETAPLAAASVLLYSQRIASM